jgi:thiol-disulfide isomerase/thioredoxin
MSDTPSPDPTPLPEPEAGGEASEPEGRPSRRATWLAMGAVAVALGLIWLAPGINDSHVDEGSGSAEADYPGEPDDVKAAGKPAPLHFTLKDMNGADVKLASFKGKVILLNFWATWCGPCKAEIPSLVELQAQYGDDLVILGVSVDDPGGEDAPYARSTRSTTRCSSATARRRAGRIRSALRRPVSVIIGATARSPRTLGNRHKGADRARDQSSPLEPAGEPRL